MNFRPLRTPTEVAFLILSLAAWVFVWNSPLAFGPVPWPDDSAFYFVAQEFFQWPPRWVMLPQAPFEPSYAEWNFNTMPLYPILIGIGRWIGIDGIYGIKFWPLGAWILSVFALTLMLYRRGLKKRYALLLLIYGLIHPILRWASVLARPESLIGLFGVLLLAGLTYGFPEPPLSFKRRPRLARLYDPVSILLALGAYAHFNAIHLLFPVIARFIKEPRRLVQIGLKTALYLTPWLITLAWRPGLFTQQFSVQWRRLAVGNGWLKSPDELIKSIIQSMGNPEPWHPALQWASVVSIMAIAVALIVLIIQLAFELKKREINPLMPAAAWVLGSCWLWHTKPEVWFTYYLHLSLLVFLGIALQQVTRQATRVRQTVAAGIGIPILFNVCIFAYTDLDQLQKMGRSQSWNWHTYDRFVECIDRRLMAEAERLGKKDSLSVWGPTFPDVLIELSRRHPTWNFSRTNDFHERNALAIEHGKKVDAVVISETINWNERDIDAPAHEHPDVQSIWFNWKDYYLHQFSKIPDWKPVRHICQTGRWSGFIYLN